MTNPISGFQNGFYLSESRQSAIPLAQNDEEPDDFRAILNRWVEERTPNFEDRQRAEQEITEFLNDESKNILNLSSFSLTSLPPIFNADPFIKRLTKLDISRNHLTSLPAEIGRLQALQRLNVSKNHLTSLPAEIGGLQALQELNVRSNRLPSLPAEIGRLQALQGLSVSSNHLTSLPAEVGRLQALQRLNVEVNQLTSLPAEIGRLQALQWLSVSSNQLASLPAEIGGLQALQGLDVSHNNTLTGVPREIFDLLSCCEITLDGVGTPV